MVFSDNIHWNWSAFGAMKDAKKRIGNAFCSVVEIRLNAGGLRKKATIS